MPVTHVLDLADGRRLAWLERGDPGGVPVLAFHGTPGSRHSFWMSDGPMLAARARLVVPDRPGYGLSSYHPGRTMADWANDVAALADHLRLERFAVIGWSGGGPHAAACARFLGDRLIGTGIVAGVAPPGIPGATDGMLAIERLLGTLARLSSSLTLPVWAAMQTALRYRPGLALRFGARNLAPADRLILERPDIRAAFLAETARSSLGAARAAAQDEALFARDWGFRLDDIRAPVHLWHGVEDRDIPLAHSEAQAALIPQATLHRCPGEGHLVIVDHLEEILRTITR